MTLKPWQFLLLFAVAVILGGAGVLGVGQLEAREPRDPGAATWTCGSADVVASAALQGDRVVVDLVVRDPKARAWIARIDDGPQALAPTEDGTAAVTRFVTGDLDEGTTRAVRLRVVGGDVRCPGEVSLAVAAK